MPKKASELSSLAVRNLKRPGHYSVGGVAGLALQITNSGARSWVLRVCVGSRRRDMGLGGFPDVGLAEARDKARAARALVEQGTDPIMQRQQARSALAAQQAAQKTFEQSAIAFIDAKSAQWSNAKHVAQWTNTLKTYAFPVMGKLLVRDVALPHVLQVLEPLWPTKTETATRVRARIEAILDWATVHRHREGPNPARWRGHLDKILPTPGKVAPVQHHPALPIDSVPAFMKALRSQSGTAPRVLEFAILTAARSGEVRGANWSEVDLHAAEWIVPAERMKAGREHRVALSAAAVQLLKSVSRADSVDLIFPSPKGKALSDMALLAVMRRMKVNAVPHGFRSTFKDWASERTTYPAEPVEMALAHKVPDKVEAAYRRGDLLEKRRRLMEEWGKFCASNKQHAAKRGKEQIIAPS
jgi:integrase